MGILMGNTEKSRGNGNSHGIPIKNPVGMEWEWEFKINSHGKPALSPLKTGPLRKPDGWVAPGTVRYSQVPLYLKKRVFDLCLFYISGNYN